MSEVKIFENTCKQIGKDLANFKKTVSPDRRTKNYVTTRLDLLESNFSAISQGYQDIVRDLKMKEDVFKSLDELFNETKEIYYQYKSMLMDELDKYPSVVQSNAQVELTKSASQKHDIRLPKIHPPSFTGEYQNWRSFHDQFVSLVHNNSSLSKIEKLHYLKSCCKESAGTLLDHINIDDASYDQAWELLKSRYDFKRILVNNELKLFYDLPVVHDESAKGIRELLDNSTKILHSLKNLGLPVDQWDAIIIFMLVKKLPSKIQSLWETSLGTKKEIPTFKELSAFLETKFRTLEMMDQQLNEKSTHKRHAKNVFHVNSEPSEKFTCKVCHRGVHSLRTCDRFLKMDVNARQRVVKQFGNCFNCLAYSHRTNTCPSNKTCHFCQRPHNSLLHFNNNNTNFRSSHLNSLQNNSNIQQTNQSNTNSNNTFTRSQAPSHSHTNTRSNIITHPNTNTNNQSQTLHISTQINPNAPSFQPSDIQQQSTSANCFHLNEFTKSSQILLATAIVKVLSAQGNFVKLRALIDSGSQASFITESAAQLLGLKKHHTFFDVSVIGKTKSSSCQNYVELNIGSNCSDFETFTRGYVYKNITGLLPNHEVNPTKWKHIQGLTLADPEFHRPANIDLLLGNDVYCEAILPDIIRGEVPIDARCTLQVLTQFVDIDQQLRQFWEIEESPYEEDDKEEDVACEQHFLYNSKRLPGGRFEVSLPFKENNRPALKSTHTRTLAMFYKQEKKLLNNTELYNEYNRCIAEYLELNQMEEVQLHNDSRLNTPFQYVVPHHAVFKETSTTTKLRVVFNASFKTSDGNSLNDHLLTGPKTQTDIISIVLRWRTHKITFASDIEKMYRQIQIHPDDAYYQLLYWREDPTIPVKLYKVKVLMFGTAPAPYLANRTLKKLACDEEGTYPLAAKMVREDMYIDDLVSGADSLQEAKEKYIQISSLLLSDGFRLRKWMSNSKDLLNMIPQDERETNVSLTFGTQEDHTKTLGISWYPSSDSFSFQKISIEEIVSKRTILSTIARMFDPLGWISPCIIKPKIIMQQLWLRGLSWDEIIPVELQQEWLSFQEELAILENIRIPRWINTQSGTKYLELHGFSDASIKAYGAAVYVRVLDSNNHVYTDLLISKTRVAPVNTISLPRLELCGAVMLAKLLNYTKSVLPFKHVKTYAWTDSTITLCWITATPSRWKTFIANRVTEIQRLTNISIWKHIPTKLNPADLASRGVLPSKLINNTLWWKGPAFLQEKWEFSIPTQPTQFETEEEKRDIKVHIALNDEQGLINLIYKHSTLQEVVRSLAFVNRFVNNVRKSKEFRMTSHLSPMELKLALVTAARIVQQEMFHDVISELKKTKTTKLYKSLNLFLDKAGIIRIGGRLQNSSLTYDEKHPIILKSDHVFTKLIIYDAHECTLHGGLQQVILYVRNKFWIFNIKGTVKKIVGKCITCFRNKPKPMQQLMGNLSAPRVNISRPFTHTGVDYAGPMEVKAWKGRNSKKFKGYFAIFIYLATKAIHLEAVTDLTTQAFIAAFRRFTARRGICFQIYSDCGTNFKGANTELQEMLKAAKHDYKEIAESLSKSGTNWNFIPPASPHFGGLWEAGVKSVKYHLRRVARNESLTFEELSTLLCQIEACLNSRPLCPLTDSFEDFTALTPAHFLIGTSSHVVPEADLENERIGYLDRWKRLQASLQTFWKQWSSEYLNRLQNRPKWLKTKEQPRVGDLVLLKDERLPPSRWLMARIIVTYPGEDELIRVVKVKTQNGELKRPITKICPLPSNNTITENPII